MNKQLHEHMMGITICYIHMLQCDIATIWKAVSHQRNMKGEYKYCDNV